MNERVIYMKGGNVIAEAEKLVHRRGELPDGGPDKFLLSMLHLTRNDSLFLVGEGDVFEQKNVLNCRVSSYAIRPRGKSKILKRASYLKSALRFAVDAIRFKPTKIFCGFEGAFAVIALYVAKLCGAEFIFLAHCALAINSTSSATKKANAILCRQSDHLVVHGPFLHDQALSLGASRSNITEWNNGLDPSHRKFLEAIRGTATESSTVLYFGRVEEEKGVFDLLNAFCSLPRGLASKLQFIGAGTALEELRSRAAGSSRSADVEVVGPVKFEDIFTYITRAAVVVTPTRSSFAEGLCQSAIESFYAGKPVIAPDFGPFPYIIQHEVNGLIYTHDSVDSMAEALNRFFSEKALRSQLDAGAELAGQAHGEPKVSFRSALQKVLA